MYKELCVLWVACLFYGSALHAQGRPTGTSIPGVPCPLAAVRYPGALQTGMPVSSGSGPEKHTLTRIDYSDGTMLVFGVQTWTMPLSEQGAILDNLLDQSIRQCPLPDNFDVRIGETDVALIKELQQKLMQPGANWNLAKGRPLRGNFDSVLAHELTAILVQSPIGMAFAHYGYKLHVDGLEHIEEEPKKFPRAGARVPTDIFVMEIIAERSQKP